MIFKFENILFMFISLNDLHHFRYFFVFFEIIVFDSLEGSFGRISYVKFI